jgi:hypothetical protein
VESKWTFEMYVLSEDLITTLGDALVDTGSQVSLVKESSLTRGSKIRTTRVCIKGITGHPLEIKGQVELSINDAPPHSFLITDQLPRNHDIILGQDWLEKVGYNFQIPSLGIILPAYLETLVKIPTKEKGAHLIESKELQENVFCASSIVECVGNSFLCLLINLNQSEQPLQCFPQTQELLKLNCQIIVPDKRERNKRVQTLQSQLRLTHIKEGEESIRQICTEYKCV